VLGADEAPAAVARLSMLRIRDFMLSKLDPALAQLELLRPIISTADPVLYNHLPKSQPSFALAGTITMFAHNIQEYKDITRLFDFFLAHDAVMPIYFFAAVVLSRREEMLEIEKEDEDIMHAVLGKLPQPFDVEFHIARTVELYERMAPDKLGSWAWWWISASSVLKTSSGPAELIKMSLEDGERLIQQQEKEVRKQQILKKAALKARYFQRKLWYYRRHSAYGLAIAVGVYALWLGRSRGVDSRFTLLGPFGALFKRMMGKED
jgi:TBC1 domain family member 20